jgi:hypothetical protein
MIYDRQLTTERVRRAGQQLGRQAGARIVRRYGLYLSPGRPP